MKAGGVRRMEKKASPVLHFSPPAECKRRRHVCSWVSGEPAAASSYVGSHDEIGGREGRPFVKPGAAEERGGRGRGGILSRIATHTQETEGGSLFFFPGRDREINLAHILTPSLLFLPFVQQRKKEEGE